MERKRNWTFWIVARDQHSGQDYLIFGSDKSEDEARMKGMEMLGSTFEIRRFPTRDLGAASAMYKGKRLERTHDIHKATRRLKHKVKGRAESNSPYDSGIFS